jgi:hypothetical protein
VKNRKLLPRRRKVILQVSVQRKTYLLGALVIVFIFYNYRLQKELFFLSVIMELEPETLSLWYDMIKAIKSHIKYSHSVKKIVSDIKVTDIFCDLHHDAVSILESITG